ncbi:hypothetical protein KIN20_036614 [Parelaphostrongylus tenuis]|uniref:Uncharacterized protein n=1 Tax=Parelaphostrongylus tenuis TaxID=148309 RepID=A0AAD5RDE0_PARTN|nr:hypothetical protein KIN20_036614 [Parelaphostrongylus tenuis]
MGSTRGLNPTLAGRVAPIRQRHSGVYGKIRAKNGRSRKRQRYVRKCAQHADQTRLSSDVWRPSDNGTAEKTGEKRKESKGATVCEKMRSTRGSNPTLVGRVASVRQRHSGVDDKNPCENGRSRKRQRYVSEYAQHADQTRLSSDVWRPSDSGKAE